MLRRADNISEYNLHAKMPKEEAVVVVRNGDSEVSLPPVSAGTEYNVKELADDDLTDDHPKVPGWFSDFCPIWPGGFHLT